MLASCFNEPHALATRHQLLYIIGSRARPHVHAACEDDTPTASFWLILTLLFHGMKLYFCRFLTGHKRKDELRSSGTYAMGWAKEKVDFILQAVSDSCDRTESKMVCSVITMTIDQFVLKFHHLAAVIESRPRERCKIHCPPAPLYVNVTLYDLESMNRNCL